MNALWWKGIAKWESSGKSHTVIQLKARLLIPRWRNKRIHIGSSAVTTIADFLGHELHRTGIDFLQTSLMKTDSLFEATEHSLLKGQFGSDQLKMDSITASAEPAKPPADQEVELPATTTQMQDNTRFVSLDLEETPLVRERWRLYLILAAFYVS